MGSSAFNAGSEPERAAVALRSLPLLSAFQTMYWSALPAFQATSYPLGVCSAPIGVQAPNWPATTSEPAYFRDGPLPVPSCRKNSLATWPRSRIVPLAVAVPMAGFDSVTVKLSSGSTTVSPATLTVIVLLVSPAAKLTVPEGKAAPTKSDPAAGLAPLPVTAQLALVAVLVLPPRVTVKVNGVLPH